MSRLSIHEKLLSKRAAKDKSSKAGVFITLPVDFAKQFPLLGKHDDSKPHITALFIGKVPKKHEKLLLEIVKNVAKEYNPFEIKLDDKITYFPPTKHSEGCKVAKLKIISDELHKLHKKLKSSIIDAGISVDDHFPVYKPHVTVAYMEPPKKTYDRDFPSGSWVANEVQIWNGDKKNTIVLGENKKANMNVISIRAKVKSDKPAYKEKKKTDKGYVWIYDEKHVEKRWKEKKDKLKKLEKDLDKVRKQYREDLKSDDERTRAIAAIVGIMDDTAMRIGNEESAKEGTFGASTLKVKHVKGGSGKITFDFPGKGSIEQNVTLENNEVIKAVRDLMKGKKADDFIFEIDGKKIWDRAVNRYLKPMGISAKDLRGFHANRLMKEMLQKKDFKEALDEVAEIVGHEASTLKNQYLDPELVEKHEDKEKSDKDKKKKKAHISVRAKRRYEQIQQTELGGEELQSRPDNSKEDIYRSMMSSRETAPVDIHRNVSNIRSKVSPRGYEQVKITPQVAIAWRIIAPFLPEGAELSSGFRSEQDQVNTIKNYWYRKWNGYFAKNFPDKGRNIKEMQRFMNKEYNPSNPNTPKGGPSKASASIAAPGKSRHQFSGALDIHKVNYRRAEKIIYWLNRNMRGYVKFSPHREGDHIHISVRKAIWPGPKNMIAVLRKFYYAAKLPKLYKSQFYTPALSKQALLSPRDEGFVDNLEQKYFGQRGSQKTTHENGFDQLSISPRAKPSKEILSAWVALKPFLPNSATLTSGARTSEDQIRIINNYWGKSKLLNKYPDVKDPYERSKLLIKHDWIVGPPTTNKKNVHLTGRAFDVSGANLQEIADVAKKVSSNPNIPVTFSQVLIEDKNNAVHIGIKDVLSDPQAMLSKINILMGKASVGYIMQKHALTNAQDEISSIYEDLINSSPPKEILQEYENTFKINTQSKLAFDLGELQDAGLGLLDEPGDWFEKSPMFVHREDVPDYDDTTASETEASELANEEPDKFFYRGLHKEYPDLEMVALKNMIKDNAKFYFIFKYNEKDEQEYKGLFESAAEALAQQDARAFFYFHLHHSFPELGRGAIVQLIDTNPDSFFDLGLDKDYPDYVESAGNARNIKDPNKVELEQPEWINSDSDKPVSLRDRNAAKCISRRAINNMEAFSEPKIINISSKDSYEISCRSSWLENTTKTSAYGGTRKLRRNPGPSGSEDTTVPDRGDNLNRGTNVSTPESVQESLQKEPDYTSSPVDHYFNQEVDIRNIEPKNVVRYFLFKHYKKDKYRPYNKEMLPKLFEVEPSKFFDLELFLDPEFKDETQRAAFHVAVLEPHYFFDIVLPNFTDLASGYTSLADKSLQEGVDDATRRNELMHGPTPKKPWWKLSKRAGKLDYPKAMLKDIMAWIESISGDLKKPLFGKAKKRKIGKSFKIDIDDTDQGQKHDWVRSGIKDVQSNDWDRYLTITLYSTNPYNLPGEMTGGSYNEEEGEHYIWIFDTYNQIKSGEIEETLKHELTHMMQKIMTTLTHGFGTKPGGLAGMPMPHSFETEQLYGKEEGFFGSDWKEQTRLHHISDVEFFPLLSEEIHKMKATMLETDPKLKKMMLDNQILESEFLQNLKNYDTSMYNKALRELYRAFGEL